MIVSRVFKSRQRKRKNISIVLSSHFFALKTGMRNKVENNGKSC